MNATLSKTGTAPTIYLTGGDSYAWALDEDLKQTQAAIDRTCLVNSYENADIIHSVYWEALKDIPDAVLAKKHVICNLSGEWDRYKTDFTQSFLHIAQFVDLWVVRSKKAQSDMERRGRACFFIPYTVDTQTFRPLDKKDLRNLSYLPKDKYIIGNFMRDTLAGGGKKPKLVKGPDIFADIVTILHNQGLPVHALLAGPRRHWLRSTLKSRKIPYTYIGWPIPFEDMRVNTLNRKKLNILYNRLDLSLVSSRSEAGPHAILEAAAAHCPQISTPVGIARDVLDGAQIYKTVEQAVEIISRDIVTKYLKSSLSPLSHKISASHTSDAVRHLYQKLYKVVLK